MSYNRIVRDAGVNSSVRPGLTRTLRSMRERPMGSGPDPNHVRVSVTPTRRSMTDTGMGRIKNALTR